MNQSQLARDTALPRPTTHRYQNPLETACQIARLPTVATSRTKRLVKSPKLYCTDPGLGLRLATLGLGKPELTGDWLENP